MKMMKELIALNQRLAEIIAANSDTPLVELMRSSGTEMPRPEGYTRTIRDGSVFQFYTLHTPVVVAHDWTLEVGTQLALDHSFVEILENKVLAVPHEDLVLTVVDAADGIPEMLNAKANTRFVVNDLDVRYTSAMPMDFGNMQCKWSSCYVISGAEGGPEEDGPLVNVTYSTEREYDAQHQDGYVDKPFVQISILGQPEATALPSKYQLVIDALMVNEANR